MKFIKFFSWKFHHISYCNTLWFVTSRTREISTVAENAGPRRYAIAYVPTIWHEMFTVRWKADVKEPDAGC